MALKKSYAGKVVQQTSERILDDGSIVKESKQVCEPTRHIDMHPLEEAATLAHWAMSELQSKIPRKPSQKDEHEWMIEHGADYVKQMRSQWRAAYDAAQPELKAVQDKFQAAHDAWNLHAEICHSHGLDYDTFIGDASKKLSLKKGE